MKNVCILIVSAIVIVTACKKSGYGPDQLNTNNEVRAMVSINGGVPSVHKANANYTQISRTFFSSGDTLLTISGTIGQPGTVDERSISLQLKNISRPGTYSFKLDATSRQHAACNYVLGAIVLSPIYVLYSTDDLQNAGFVTIEELTATYVKGTFQANCANYAVITNGTFKGNIAP